MADLHRAILHGGLPAEESLSNSRFCFGLKIGSVRCTQATRILFSEAWTFFTMFPKYSIARWALRAAFSEAETREWQELGTQDSPVAGRPLSNGRARARALSGMFQGSVNSKLAVTPHSSRCPAREKESAAQRRSKQ